jgi:alpha/beta superfamily hydrolase
MSIQKLKILCLHGKQQNKEIFRTKLGRLPHKLRNLADFTIIDAPHILEEISTEDVTARTWFYREPEGNNVNIGSLLTAVQQLQQTWTESGPYDGVLGFSMGGTMASLMAGSCNRLSPITTDASDGAMSSAGQTLFPGLRFVICAGAVDIHPSLENIIEQHQLPFQYPFKIPAEIASLHIAGTADTAVPIASSIALSQRYQQPVFIEHEQGHHIPMKAHILAGIVDFVAAQQCAQKEVAV